MKKLSLLPVFLLCSLILLSANASAYTIDDDYIGADPTANSYDGEDRIGDEKFEVYGMNVVFNPGMNMQVSIHSKYFSNVGALSTKLGDLFISTDGYNPYGDAPYENDNASNGEDWEYAIVLDDHEATSGNLNIYEVNKDGIKPSFANSGYIYRAGQEVQYSPVGQQKSLGTDNWSISGDWLTLCVPWLDDWNGVDLFGFHWAMTCANDVIEGSAPIPEPATMLLLGVGLIGLAGVSRKKMLK